MDGYDVRNKRFLSMKMGFSSPNKIYLNSSGPSSRILNPGTFPSSFDRCKERRVKKRCYWVSQGKKIKAPGGGLCRKAFNPRRKIDNTGGDHLPGGPDKGGAIFLSAAD
ncbi:hypothetical protein CEXT_386701 [Caerostris extrusa]|uniref:Uncharacterized protein n=1 Tax=Caerostris extrusa TaxID=172846 RepID=A0AAV4RID6_CAEEX|nr:hypothetical protein CEXT_386701 [Caerostris extrusa]